MSGYVGYSGYANYAGFADYADYATSAGLNIKLLLDLAELECFAFLFKHPPKYSLFFIAFLSIANSHARKSMTKGQISKIDIISVTDALDRFNLIIQMLWLGIIS